MISNKYIVIVSVLSNRSIWRRNEQTFFVITLHTKQIFFLKENIFILKSDVKANN